MVTFDGALEFVSKATGDDPVMKTPCKGVLAVAVILCLLLAQSPARAYSVLTHEANIDSLWESAIQPLLKERFPAATQQELIKARAYAYGGCIIQDLGYYPFGSKFFREAESPTPKASQYWPH